MRRRRVYGGLLTVVGLALAAIQVVQGLEQSNVLIVRIVDIVPFAGAGLGLAFAGLWLANRTESEDYLPRILLWGVGGGIAFVSVAALLLFGQQVSLGTLSRAPYVAMDHLTVGALSGVLVGLYDAQSQRRLRELQTERDRIEDFAGKAADVNNYGRAINQSAVVEEVAAYTVQGVESLTGCRETGMLEVKPDDVDIVGATWSKYDVGTLDEAAHECAESPLREVVVHDEGVVTDFEGADTLLAAHVTDAGDVSVVLLAVVDDDVKEEDVQLLEHIVSHAATALDSIYEERVGADV